MSGAKLKGKACVTVCVLINKKSHINQTQMTPHDQGSVLLLSLLQVELVQLVKYVHLIKVSVSQSRVQVPRKGHRIYVRGHEMINGKENKIKLHFYT